MQKRIFIIGFLIVLCLSSVSCGAFQLKWDREVQKHMETLLTTPDAEVMSVIEEWNKQSGLKPGMIVNLDFLKPNLLKMEFDNRKGQCRVYIKTGLDFDTQRKVVGQAMVVYGSLYWKLPEQKRESVYLLGNIEEEEDYVMSWKRGDAQPVFDKDRTGNYT